MSSEVQPRPDDSPNTSGGSSDAEQREAAPPEQPGPEQRDQTQPKKKEAKISSKTAAKLSTSAKRIQKELAEITLDPPPNCRHGIVFDLSSRAQLRSESMLRSLPPVRARHS
ncbi:ubiquitin-conjugating enzyme E2 [Collichthys lucidus]|uniref:Ubiquitin-conjugating enzyme E2 n=1 Tax=Collichthys lucidus TaxID=240159 RepID=A0A4U5VL18_COLLU|nr:ubiquitin-conjugating enzyme E2 [Collichthys lucidus]